jgi:hypothetical protein
MSPESKSRNTALYILSGLLAGILIGFGVALVIEDRSISDVVPFLQSGRDTTKTDEVSARHRAANGRAGYAGNHQTDRYPGIPGETDNTIPYDSLDQAALDSLAALTVDGSDIVMRDELLSSRRVKIIAGSDPLPQKQAGNADSLLTTLTGVKVQETFPSDYTLEFWRNPLNFKGYKMQRDKIILFGLPPELNYQLLYLDGTLVLQNQKTQYILRETSEYLPLIPRKLP